MKLKTLQRADRLIGVPVCFVLTCIRRILGGRTAAPTSPRRRLLFVKLAEQGATILAYPALRRAVELVGRQNVYFLAFEENRLILDVMGVVPEANVITISTKNVVRLLWDMLRAVLRLRRLNLDVAIDLEFFSRGSAALTYLSDARQRAGYHAFCGAGPYRGNLMTHRLLYNPHLHTSRAFLALVEAAFCDPALLPALNPALPAELPQPPRIVPNPQDLTHVYDILGWQTGQRRPLILLNPNSGDLLALRRWPTERYVELSRRLLVNYPQVVLVFTGTIEEAAATAELVRQVASDRCLSLAGKTNLRQLLALYALAEVLVTNDSGQAHFAALTTARVVTLFGPETPELFAPYTPRHVVLWAQLPCSPCVSAYNHRQSPCRNNLCLHAITIDQVFLATCHTFELQGQLPGAFPATLAVKA